MKPSIKITRLNLVVFAVCSFALLSEAKAVSPAPDGGYPNFTTAEGQNALSHLTTGAANTAVGWFSLDSITTGSFNTAVGAGTLLSNTGDENTAVGTAALLLNTASGNTAVGSRALLNNTTGGTLGTVQGTDVGPNVAVGWEALESNTVASANTAVGYQALHSFTSGPMGFEQVGLCTAIGFQALANANTSGVENTANGYKALFNNTTGTSNTASGGHALIGNMTGDGNTADGFVALWHNTSGGYNTAAGSAALADNTTGMFNTALGYQAGVGLTTGDNNIYIGAGASGDPSESDVMRIGHTQSATYIVGIFGATVAGGTPVLIDSEHKLGTVTSSRRFKQDIRPMDKTSEALLALKPVTFRYKQEIDPVGAPQFGLVAEEVEKVNPDLVVRDKEGKPYSVRYDQVNAMLLNEFLKEHRKNETQQGQIEEQELAISQLKSTLAEQQKTFEAKLAQQEQQIAALTAQLQRLAADIELNKTEPQAVAEK
jgi:trimeric autotransporter adhesin